MSQLRQNGGAAPVLQVHKIPLQHAQRHLCFGRRTAHNGIERLAHLIEATEGDPQADPVFEIGQRAGHAVKVQANGGGDVLLEALDVLLMAASVPEKALVVQSR